jgi:tripartite-type tricarboxylate transporter receptor subunit TctC
VIVENRVGAQGNIAVAAVAKAPPDGYTLALMPVGNAAVNPWLFSDLPYDPVKDFEPVTLIATVENVLVVGAGQPAKTVGELIALGRSTGLTYMRHQGLGASPTSPRSYSPAAPDLR